jgi:acyl-CoA dehydrogenase
MLREQARRFLKDQSSTKAVRKILEGGDTYDRALWKGMADMGWLGAAVPEEYGGAGLGHEGLCVLAEEIGRAHRAGAVRLVRLPGHRGAARPWQPRSRNRALAARPGQGRARSAASRWPKGWAIPSRTAVNARVENGKLSGAKWPVQRRRCGRRFRRRRRQGSGRPDRLYLRRAHRRPACHTHDAEERRPLAQPVAHRLSQAPAQPLGEGAQGWAGVERLLDRAAVLMAFEQVGGASACLDMAVAYANERFAFGRPIGSFQAIKHKLADVYIATELARSNAYYGAWALSTDAPELALAAATARVAGSPMRSISPPRKTSRPTAAWVSPGRWTATCSIGAPS